MMRANKFFTVLLLTLVVSCSDQPSRAKFPGPPGRTTDLQQAQNQQAVMGGTDSFSQRFENSESQPGNSGKTLSGTIVLAEGITLPSNYLLFIAVRRPEGGPPMAALRIPMAQFPYTFHISQQNVMMPGTKLEGSVVLSATVDQDGNPISKSPGDSAGFMTAEMGQKDLRLTIDQKYQ